jgi:beta-lactamase class A
MKNEERRVNYRAMRAAAFVSSLFALMINVSMASAEPLADRVAALTKNFKGSVYVYAKNLKTASTIKLPILCTLESLVAQGKVRWDERLVLKPEDKVTGSGVLGSLADGTDLTVRNVATLMIIVSDNTATNLIIDRITADAVNDYLDSIGIHQTRSNRKVRGDGNQLKAPTGWSKAGKLEENAKYGLGVTTPREMVQILEMLDQGKIVSPAASKDILDIMKMQQERVGISRRTPEDLVVASKHGSLDALRSDVGIVYDKDAPIAIAITVDDMPEIDYSPDNVGDKLIADLSDALRQGLATP